MAVRITNDDAVRVIVLDRPRARNALNTELMAELAAALSEADADHRVRAVVITGSQQTFCAGADLGALDGLTVSDSLAADGFGKRFSDSFMTAESRPSQPSAARPTAADANWCSPATSRSVASPRSTPFLRWDWA